MTIESTPRNDAFAAFQQKLSSAGIRVGSPAMVSLQQAAQFYAKMVADEAVAGATLCLTEADIGHALSQWAAEEEAAGQVARAVKLRRAAVSVLELSREVDEARAVAILKLPPAAPELPEPIRARVDRVLALVYGPRSDTAPIHRLFATVVHELLRVADRRPASAVNAPPLEPDQPDGYRRDANLGEWLSSYAIAMAGDNPRNRGPSLTVAKRVTRDIINGDGFALVNTLKVMADARGLRTAEAVKAYLSGLDFVAGDLDVPQPSQQQQSADNRKGVMPYESAEGEHVNRPRREGGSGGAGIVAQQQQAQDVRGDGGFPTGGEHVRDIPPPERTGKPLVMSHLVASARQSPAHAFEAAMEALRNAGAVELARTVEIRCSTVAALQPRTKGEAAQAQTQGPQAETHNFPGTPGGPPLNTGRPDLVSTMIPRGGVHQATWDQAVEACAAYAKEYLGGQAGEFCAKRIRDDVKPPKAG